MRRSVRRTGSCFLRGAAARNLDNMNSKAIGFIAGCVLLGAGCGAPAPTTSTIAGQIAQSSFPSPVDRITVVRDDGKVTKIPVGAAGAFKLVLTQGATYRF